MKKLVTRLLVCLVFIVLLHFSSLSFVAHVFSNNDIYRLDTSKTVLLIGDSHVEMAVNDSGLKNVRNIAQAADMYIYSYGKLKKLLNVNPHVKTVIIGCGAHNFQKYMSNVFLINTNYTVTKMQTYYHVLPFSDLSGVVSRSPSQAITGLFWLPREKARLAISGFVSANSLSFNDMNWGGFAYHDGRMDKSNNLLKYAALKAGGNDLTSVWDWQIDYLHRIVDLCRNKGVHVVFVRMPEHKDFPREIEPGFQMVLKQQFSDVPFIDYLGMELPDSCFYDFDHLNCYGSVLFTDTFRHLTDTL